MLRARRTASALVAALILVLALACGTAVGAEATAAPAAGDGTTSVTEGIFLDYSFDREINGDWSASELQAAIAVAKRQGAGFEEFEQAVQDVYDRDFLGLHTGDGDGATPQPPDETSTLLPEPRGPGERDQPPWPFLAMTAMAAALVVTGAGSSIYRRVHR